MESALKEVPSHHDPRGGFHNPWPGARGAEKRFGDFLRWRLERLRASLPPNPPDSAFPRKISTLVTNQAPDSVAITWVGHSTFIIQIAGTNLLTDPMWSLRSSPVQWMGPVRMTRPGIAFEDLPDVHGVLLSHDHYDHLDSTTVKRIARRYPQAPWYAPLGHAGYLEALGVRSVHELDWWQQTELDGYAAVQLTCLPVQHWTRRLRSPAYSRLWCSWSIASANCKLYFAGDSGYCPAFREIGERVGPFTAALLPIGAYEPRWFMRFAHMNPEESLQAYWDLRAREFIAMHWGTFRLTDEDPLEPPARIRAAWQDAKLPADRLHVPAFGETIVLEHACHP